DGKQRERAEERHRVAMHGPDEAVQTVPAETRTPVQVRLEQSERQARRDEEEDAPEDEPRQREPRSRDERVLLERESLANGDDRKPEHCRCEHRGDGNRDDQNSRELRAARLVLEPEYGERLPGRKRVDDRARRDDDAGGEHGPDRRADHLTWRVKGAVRIFPPTCAWRNRRQVPGTGTSTPTVSLPGVVDLPVTCAPPRKLVQPVAPGAQTWVWK